MASDMWKIKCSDVADGKALPSGHVTNIYYCNERNQEILRSQVKLHLIDAVASFTYQNKFNVIADYYLNDMF